DALEELMGQARVVTPNIPEAEKLCRIKIVTRADMENAARILSGITRGAVLVKGGHYDGDAADILYHNGRMYEFVSQRIDNPNTHGTGCTLSSAIACGLAEGKSCYDAVSCAKEYVTKVISAGLDIGQGNGPMWHFV
ncbi:MAG: hydroxymethylpyrimidine/phosphomethylpyrimidine kinase, partial [Huintestinicola sp.]